MQSKVIDILGRDADAKKDDFNKYKEYAAFIENNIEGKEDPNIKKMINYISEHIFGNNDLESGNTEPSDEDKIKKLATFKLLAEPFKKILETKGLFEEIFKDMWGRPESFKDPKLKRLAVITALAAGAAAVTGLTSPDDPISQLSAIANVVVAPALLWSTVKDKNLSVKDLDHKAILSLLPDLLVAYFSSPAFGKTETSNALGFGSGAAIAGMFKLVECYGKNKDKQKGARAADDMSEAVPAAVNELSDLMHQTQGDPMSAVDPQNSTSSDIGQKFDEAFDKAISSGNMKSKTKLDRNVSGKLALGTAITAAKAWLVKYSSDQGYGNATKASLAASLGTAFAAIREDAFNPKTTAAEVGGIGAKPLIAAGALLILEAKLPEDLKKDPKFLVGLGGALGLGITVVSRSVVPLLQNGIKAVGPKDERYGNAHKQYLELTRKASPIGIEDLYPKEDDIEQTYRNRRYALSVDDLPV